MRPLTANSKTALIFYLAFAGLLLLLNNWSPTGLVNADMTATSRFTPDANRLLDITRFQTEFDESWQNYLVAAGYNPDFLLKLRESQYRETESGLNTIQWITAKERLELPAATSEAQLVKLGIAWKKHCDGLGPIRYKTNWGYSDHKLWVKLVGELQLTIAHEKLVLPIQEITLLQPIDKSSRDWQLAGLIPTMAPPLPPRVADQVSIVEKPNPLQSQVKPFKPLPKSQFPNIKRHARVAIIIDDVGYQSPATERFLQIPARLTWSILPFTPAAAEYLSAGKKQGFEIMLHLPLEPLARAKTPDPGPGVIKRSWSETEIRDQLAADLQAIPGVVGINNHMGSAGTSDARLMDILMGEIKLRHLFFVDSNTIANSFARKYAEKYHLPFAINRVFIDNSSELEDKKAKLRELIKLALRDGEALAIGHVRPGTAEAIEAILPEFIAAGIEIVPVSELVK